MPPSPKLQATLDEEVYARACADLGITPPKIVVMRIAASDGAYGRWEYPPSRITIYLGGIEKYTSDRLRAAQGELVDTVLHELRHAQQHVHNPTIIQNKHACEVDAEGWAKRNRAKYRTIIRLHRTFQGSGFSRLGRHSRQAV